MNPPPGPFAAVLLAGGRSRRMGRDKALLPLPDNRALWQRQWHDVLLPLEPAELYLSGTRRPGFPPDLPVVPDEMPGCGPLGGIATILKMTSAPIVLVLAIDLPAMTDAYLRMLLAQCRPGVGAVPRRADGFYEPLAAVYPKAALESALARLNGDDFSLQPWVRAGIALRWLHPCDIAASEALLFANWNSGQLLPGSRANY